LENSKYRQSVLLTFINPGLLEAIAVKVPTEALVVPAAS